MAGPTVELSLLALRCVLLPAATTPVLDSTWDDGSRYSLPPASRHAPADNPRQHINQSQTRRHLYRYLKEYNRVLWGLFSYISCTFSLCKFCLRLDALYECGTVSPSVYQSVMEQIPEDFP